MSGLLQLPWKTEISWQGNNLEPFFGFTKQFLFLEGPTLLRTIKWHEPTRSFKLIGLSLTPKAIQFLVTLCDRGPCDPMRSYVTQAEIRKNYVREVLNCVFTPFFHTPPKINRSNLKKNWFGRCCSFSRGPVFSGSILIFQKGVFSPLEFPSTSSPKKKLPHQNQAPTTGQTTKEPFILPLGEGIIKVLHQHRPPREGAGCFSKEGRSGNFVKKWTEKGKFF